MSKIIKGRVKLAIVWVVLTMLVIGFSVSEKQAHDLKTILTLLVPVALVFLAYKKRPKKNKQLKGFALTPENHHKDIIRFYGQVRKVLPDTVAEKLKRKSVDFYRTLIDDDDPKGRHIHQRIIVGSPAFHDRDSIIIYHNTKFTKVRVRRGSWVYCQGEYIHRSGRKRYGLVHYTHKPKGFIEVLGKKPDLRQSHEIEVISGKSSR